MTHHQRFGFENLADLEAKIASLGLDIRLDTDLEPLSRRIRIGALETPNSLAIHPLEGRDSTPDGRPGELTLRRYQRFAEGGAGLIWFEATAVVPEGRASPRQLLLNKENLSAFKELLHRVEQSAVAAYSPAHRPMAVLQLTHSGRSSKPVPVIAVHNETLDAKLGLPSDYPLISDGELEALENRFVEAAKLAHQVGFRACDIKACHGYLASELLAARTRPGRYGGSFENRTRLLINIVDKIRKQVGNDLTLAIRLNAYDGIPYPHGWGVSREDVAQEDLAEPIRLVRLLYDRGVRVVSISAGNPYYNPHVTRPFDTPVQGGAIPSEHPLQGVARLFRMTRQIQQAVPEMVIVGTGYSWLRQFLGYAAAANIRNGWVTIVGVGREALAYPNFARDLLTKGKLDPKKTCITCSRCSQLMRDGDAVGCVVFDPEVYRPIYERLRAGRSNMANSPLSPHLRHHPAVQRAHALSCSSDDPVGPPSLFRLRLAHPDMDLKALLFQALDAVLWVSGQRVTRLRLQGTRNDTQGLLVLGDGCLCTLDLRAEQPAALAFELHGRRGLLQYDDMANPGIWLQPATEPGRNLMAWPEQCQPGPEEAEAFPSQADVERAWRAALASLAGGEVWQAAEVAV